MKPVTVLAAILGAVVGGVLLFVLGAFLGGNYANSFEFAGLRGYEATGILGLFVGLIGGGALGAGIAKRRSA